MEKIEVFLKKNFLWLLMIFIPLGILCYEVYKINDLSNKIEQETSKIRSLKRKLVSLDKRTKEKKAELKKISFENERIFRKVKTSIKYDDVTSLNSIITSLLIKHKVKVLSFKTLEETGKDPVNLILVELSTEGNEDKVIKLLDSLSNNIPLELQSLELLLPTQSLLMNLTFKAPLVRLRRP
ncbi:hypothetical protein Dester_1449 [Desulfurobacterium thermolithotrophum DSM 11699]|uniref:Uncharacterized protein n=1 Tax=Desulfurobacterium thermolithotrophum (strain DSM 11699 / BSA) TaxID=868864 RepID=F0S1Z8_DESTD|nr:hypothetical protein [Desulfurobacterium thermolithotrophum]ADY74079.1 hypothetical protein Dester_1449 [Desulfurobacterium thermolithotrophum DSM 11699]